MSLFMSLIGMAVLLGIAVLLSSNRKAINLRTVGGAFAIQFSLGAFILYVPWGQELLRGFSDAVSNVINYGNDGTSFLFGGLVSGKMFEVFGGGGFIFAFRVLPTLIFFSALISVLYYLGVMQWGLSAFLAVVCKKHWVHHARNLCLLLRTFSWVKLKHH
ncbi:nucleoside transporter NupC [Vibrio cholerae]|nr:nucleoside transporter NupC [Vibrio cholerae]